jgi:hypothetical protein
MPRHAGVLHGKKPFGMATYITIVITSVTPHSQRSRLVLSTQRASAIGGDRSIKDV